jgi:hypothetical protein
LLIPDLLLKLFTWIVGVERIEVGFRGTLGIGMIGGGVMLIVERRNGIGIRVTGGLFRGVGVVAVSLAGEMMGGIIRGG